MNVMLNPTVQQILQELRLSLEQLYGSRFKGLLLFGSYARGEGTDGSDIDVALILDDFAYAGEEIERSLDVVASLCLKYTCLIGLVPIREHDWLDRQDPFLMNVRREAMPVS